MFSNDGILWPAGQTPAAAYCAEDERLAVLAAHGTDAMFDDAELKEITDFAASLCDVPFASVTVVEEERQVFLARAGLRERETPRSTSFCAHAMLRTDPLIVEDATQNPTFRDFEAVTGLMGLRFYAGFPLVSTEGAPLGALCVIDTKGRPGGLTEQQHQGMQVLAKAVMRRLSHMRLGKSALAAVERRERDLRDMIDSVPGIAWTSDDKGNFGYVNARWQDMTGLPPPKRAYEWRDAVHPDDWNRTIATFEAAIETGDLFEDEWRLRMADGSYRWVQSRAVPVGDDGQPVQWFGTVFDVDTAHRLSEARDLLANELSHRIKNIFAVISGLIALRARDMPDVRPFAEELSAAIRALGTAHDYVRPSDGRGADRLQGLLSDLLAPYDGGSGSKVTITGDDVQIGPRAATPLALIFHELATNAAKYGALSTADGTVSIDIRDACQSDDTICVTWREQAGGGDVRADTGDEGFGSRLLRLAIEGQLGGHFTRAFSSDGIDISIVIPSAALDS